MQVFFESYLRSVLQVIVSDDEQACCAIWRQHLHRDFVSVNQWGFTGQIGEEAVLCEWRLAWLHGHYGSPWMSELSLRNDGFGAHCDATMVRCYRGRGCDVSRDVLRLHVMALADEHGRWWVVRHCYQNSLPKEVYGVCSRSQIGQDLWVLYRFAGIAKGFYLEIGANHPETLSNTYLLEKALHWDGVCVEPFPQGDWSTRKAELVQVAVGPDGGKLKFVAPGHVLGGLVDHVDLPRVQRDVPKEQQAVVEVETRTLQTILQKGQHEGNSVPQVIHYCSLDTEGSEFDILKGFPFDKCKLLSLTVEHNFREPTRSQIRQLLEGQGFALDVTVEHDDFFLLNDYRKYL